MSSLIPPPALPQMMSESPLDALVSSRTQNKQMREIFRETLDKLGGVEWLVKFAQGDPQNARVFVSTLGKFVSPTVEPLKPQERVPTVIDIPWINARRLAYKDRGSVEDAVLVPSHTAAEEGGP